VVEKRETLYSRRGGGEHLSVRRFPGDARLSFTQGLNKTEDVTVISSEKFITETAEFYFLINER
jgi:hypothetical protein